MSVSEQSEKTMAASGTAQLRSWCITVVFGLLGIALTALLVIHAGIQGILGTLSIAGLGILWLVPLHTIPIALDSQGWKALLADSDRKLSSLSLFWIAGIREAVNGLLPVLRVGGDLTGVRVAVQCGVSKSLAVASVLAEVTLTMLSQILFTLSGICLLFSADHSRESIASIIAATLIAMIVVVAFILVQRGGPFTTFKRLLKLAGANGKALAWLGEPTHFDQAIRELYHQKTKLFKAMLWQMSGLLSGVAEVWIALRLLGHPVSWSYALILESLSQAVRSASFFIPSGVGVQEGSLVLFGSMLGIAPDVSLALSLIKRLREVIFGLPFLVSWRWYEHRLLH